MINKRKMLLVSTFAIVIFAVLFLFNIIELYERAPLPRTNMPMSRLMPVPFEYRLWLSPLFLVIAIVPISYYLITKKMENNTKAILKLVSSNYKPKGKSESINKDAILKLLNFNERKVLERLIKRKGEVLQSEISRMDGMDKLKTHRAIKNLETKGVIKTESSGKTKSISLSKEIREILLK